MVEGPVFGDLNGNGHKEAALLLSQETGGSGTFFYVAAAIAKDGRLRCTNAVSIVDQVDPQTICVGDGVIVARYKDRCLEASMAEPPSIAKKLNSRLLADIWRCSSHNRNVKIRKEPAMKPMMALLLVGLVLVGCAAGMSSEQPARSKDPQIVVGRTWQWVSTVTPVEKITAAAPGRYTILLQEDGNVRVRFDCNKGRGKYTLSEGRISFGPLMATRMACPPDTQDATFMRDLQRVASFFIERGELYLELPVDSGIMRFRQAP